MTSWARRVADRGARRDRRQGRRPAAVRRGDRQGGARMRLGPRCRRAAVPESLQASLTARLDRLGPPKEVAQIAAAIGRECSTGPARRDGGRGFRGRRTRRSIRSCAAGSCSSGGAGRRRELHVQACAFPGSRLWRAAARAKAGAACANRASDGDSLFPEIGEDPARDARSTLRGSRARRRRPQGFWGSAGRSCLRNSALREAEAHFSRAVAAIRSRPSTPDLRHVEITCQIGLARRCCS